MVFMIVIVPLGGSWGFQDRPFDRERGRHGCRPCGIRRIVPILGKGVTTAPGALSDSHNVYFLGRAYEDGIPGWADGWGRQKNPGVAYLNHRYIFRVLGGDHERSPAPKLVASHRTGRQSRSGSYHLIDLDYPAADVRRNVSHPRRRLPATIAIL
jgi:hypothetical protein